VDVKSPSQSPTLDLAPSSVVLSGALDQYQAAALKEQILGAVAASHEGKQGVVMDMTSVDLIDASCLQVLLACTFQETPGKLGIKGANSAVRQWIRIAGADELFEFVGSIE
jgi:anti-anti-sigma factor